MTLDGPGKRVAGALRGGCVADAGARVAREGDSLSSVSVAGLARLRADLDGGGDFSVNAVSARAKLGRASAEKLSASLSASYNCEDWNFGTPTALGRLAPLGAINSPSVGVA